VTLRQAAWFTAAYIVIVALAVWLNLAVFCLGDAKYANGCGGFGVYIPLWELFLLPLLLAAIFLERWRKSGPSPTTRLLAYLAGIVGVAEFGWIVIDSFPALLATEAAAIAIALIIRMKTTTPRQPST